ncbi:hypothetical protein ACFL59_14380 [Planctomycetota bacterium]
MAYATATRDDGGKVGAMRSARLGGRKAIMRARVVLRLCLAVSLGVASQAAAEGEESLYWQYFSTYFEHTGWRMTADVGWSHMDTPANSNLNVLTGQKDLGTKKGGKLDFTYADLQIASVEFLVSGFSGGAGHQASVTPQGGASEQLPITGNGTVVFTGLGLGTLVAQIRRRGRQVTSG